MRPLVFWVLAASVVAGTLMAQVEPGAGKSKTCVTCPTLESAPSNGNQTISVNVDLVLINATVSDSKGRLVTGLQKEHFQIWEDKVEQKVEYFSSEDTP